MRAVPSGVCWRQITSRRRDELRPTQQIKQLLREGGRPSSTEEDAAFLGSSLLILENQEPSGRLRLPSPVPLVSSQYKAAFIDVPQVKGWTTSVSIVWRLAGRLVSAFPETFEAPQDPS